jgi:trehalose 6-phosphate synthase/phosphatase
LGASSSAAEDNRNEFGTRTGLTSEDGVIIVGHALPVIVSRLDGKWIVEWNDDNLVGSRHNPTHASSITHNLRVLWLGTVRSTEPIPKEDEDAVTLELARFSCIPIFLEPSLMSLYSEGYVMGTLWPVFHHITDVYSTVPSRWWNREEQDKRWQAYTLVNRIFANKVVEVYNEGDLVWVNGIHLLLLPSFLSRRLRSGNIGLFLNCPFPSSEIFRTLSVSGVEVWPQCYSVIGSVSSNKIVTVGV